VRRCKAGLGASMRRAILWILQTLGRYAVLLIFAGTLVLGYFWLLLLDSHPLAFFALMCIVGPLLMAGFALLIGLLFSGRQRDQGQFLSRIEAPEIWKVWDRLSPPGRTHSRRLRIDDQMNASMSERRRFAGLFGRDVTMTLGLPLIAVFDVPAVEAVMAHEIGHHDYQHAQGLTNLGEFERSFVTLFQFMPPETSLTGGFLYWLLGRAGNGLKSEIQKSSWKAEFEADAVSAAKVGPAAVARTLSFVAGASGFAKSAIHDPINQTLNNAMTIPPSPLSQLLDRLDEARSPSTIQKYADIATNEVREPSDTHPPLDQRLKALGFDTVPSLNDFGPSALSGLLPESKINELRGKFEKDWDRTIARYLRLE
jgi:Zn-dependent protease with chaperone function